MPYECKKSTDEWFPVVLLDDTDGKTPETGVAFGDLTVKYSRMDGTDTWNTYTVATGDWHEKGEGVYALRIGNAEFTAEDKYEVAVAAAVARTHRFAVEVTDKTKAEMIDDIDTLLSRVTAAVALASVCTEARLAELAAANLPADIDTIAGDVAGLGGEAMRGTDSAATAAALSTHDGKLDTVDANVDLVLADTADMQPKLGTPAASISADIATVKTDTGNIEADTQDLQTQVGTAGAGLTDLGGMSTGMKAEIEAEANDALVALNLDHLLAVAVGTGVVDDSVIANMVSKSATPTWSSFDNQQDSLENLRDTLSTVLGDTGTLIAGQGTILSAVVAVETDTQDIQAQIGTAGAGLTDLGGMSTGMKAEIEQEATDALVAIDLDHFSKVAAAPTPTIGSNLDKVMNKDGSQTFDPTTDSLEAIRDSGGGGLTAQQVRDAMKLAPTGGAPAAGSVDEHLDDILADTADIQPKLGTVIDLGDGTTIAGNLTALAGKTASAASYDRTTDSQEAIVDAGGAADWSATEKENIRHSLGVDGTKTAPIGGYGRVGNPAGASLAVDIAAVKTDTGNIETDTQDLQTQVGTAGAGLTDLGGMSVVMKAQVEQEATDALNAYDPPTKGEMDTFESNITGEVNTVESKVDTMQLDVTGIETQIGLAGAGLTDLGGMSVTMKAQVEAEATDALNAYDPPTKGEMDTFESNITGEVNTVESKVDTMQLDVTGIETQIGTAGVGLTNLGGMSASMKLEVGDSVWDEDITTHTAADSAGKELQDKLDDADFVDYSFERNVLARHANQKPSSYEAGLGAHKVTVATTQDGSGNTETESVV